MQDWIPPSRQNNAPAGSVRNAYPTEHIVKLHGDPVSGRDQTRRPLEELQAAVEFRSTLGPRADGRVAGAPLWHGWAIFDAFLAGVDYTRKQQDRRK